MIARVLWNNAVMSRPTPVLTKNTGIKNPKPIASSLPWNSSWEAGVSSVRRTTTPARNAPRMVASPKCSATAEKARANVMANRTLSWELVFSSRCTTSRSGPHTRTCWVTTTMAAVRPTNPASSPSSAPGFFDEAEKNTDNRTSGASSASDPAAMIIRPKIVSVSPASWRMGTSTPSDVATKMIPTSRPSLTWPPS